MSGALALVAGTLLGVGALAFVLYPLFFATRTRPVSRVPRPDDDSAIRALREIEFDRATGKLSDTDYAELRRAYGAKAVSALRAGGSLGGATPADEVEARVMEYRAARRECKTCGLRPETDAIYCSNCGSFLDGRCPECGKDVPESSAAFCSHCGAGLAALSS